MGGGGRTPLDEFLQRLRQIFEQIDQFIHVPLLEMLVEIPEGNERDLYALAEEYRQVSAAYRSHLEALKPYFSELPEQLGGDGAPAAAMEQLSQHQQRMVAGVESFDGMARLVHEGALGIESTKLMGLMNLCLLAAALIQSIVTACLTFGVGLAEGFAAITICRQALTTGARELLRRYSEMTLRTTLKAMMVRGAAYGGFTAGMKLGVHTILAVEGHNPTVDARDWSIELVDSFLTGVFAGPLAVGHGLPNEFLASGLGQLNNNLMHFGLNNGFDRAGLANWARQNGLYRDELKDWGDLGSGVGVEAIGAFLDAGEMATRTGPTLASLRLDAGLRELSNLPRTDPTTRTPPGLTSPAGLVINQTCAEAVPPASGATTTDTKPLEQTILSRTTGTSPTNLTDPTADPTNLTDPTADPTDRTGTHNTAHTKLADPILDQPTSPQANITTGSSGTDATTGLAAANQTTIIESAIGESAITETGIGEYVAQDHTSDTPGHQIQEPAVRDPAESPSSFTPTGANETITHNASTADTTLGGETTVSANQAPQATPAAHPEPHPPEINSSNEAIRPDPIGTNNGYTLTPLDPNTITNQENRELSRWQRLRRRLTVSGQREMLYQQANQHYQTVLAQALRPRLPGNPSRITPDLIQRALAINPEHLTSNGARLHAFLTEHLTNTSQPPHTAEPPATEPHTTDVETAQIRDVATAPPDPDSTTPPPTPPEETPSPVGSSPGSTRSAPRTTCPGSSPGGSPHPHPRAGAHPQGPGDPVGRRMPGTGLRVRLGAMVCSRLGAHRRPTAGDESPEIDASGGTPRTNYERSVRQAQQQFRDRVENRPEVKRLRAEAAQAYHEMIDLSTQADTRLQAAHFLRKDQRAAREMADRVRDLVDRGDSDPRRAARARSVLATLEARVSRLDREIARHGEAGERLDQRAQEALDREKRLTAELAGITTQAAELEPEAWAFANGVEASIPTVGEEHPGPETSALTNTDKPSPAWRTNPYDKPRGARRIPVVYQKDLEQAVPRDEDGKFGCAPDPTKPWLWFLNAFGIAVDPTRTNNCANCVRAFFDTWMHGRPTVAAARTLDGYKGGDTDDPFDGEDDTYSRLEDLTGGRYQSIANGVADSPSNCAAKMNAGLRRIAGQLLAAGHGSFAGIVVSWAEGGEHAWAAVNYRGVVYFVDPQIASVVVAPESVGGFTYHDPHTGDQVDHPIHNPATMVGIDALVVDGRSRPVPFANRPMSGESKLPIAPDYLAVQPPDEQAFRAVHDLAAELKSVWEDAAEHQRFADRIREEAEQYEGFTRLVDERIVNDPVARQLAYQRAKDTQQDALDAVRESEQARLDCLNAAESLEAEYREKLAQAIAAYDRVATHHRVEADRCTREAGRLPAGDQQREVFEGLAKCHQLVASNAAEAGDAYRTAERRLATIHDVHDAARTTSPEDEWSSRWQWWQEHVRALSNQDAIRDIRASSDVVTPLDQHGDQLAVPVEPQRTTGSGGSDQPVVDLRARLDRVTVARLDACESPYSDLASFERNVRRMPRRLYMIMECLPEVRRLREEVRHAGWEGRELARQAASLKTDADNARTLERQARADGTHRDADQHAADAQRLEGEAEELKRRSDEAFARQTAVEAEVDELTTRAAELVPEAWAFANGIDANFPTVGEDHPGPTRSALTGTDEPPAVWSTNVHNEPGGVRLNPAAHQQRLEDEIPRDEDGNFARFCDPENPWVWLINGFGYYNDRGRLFNCFNCVRAFYDTWMHGRPTVAAPIMFDGHRLGRILVQSGREKGGREKLEALLNGKLQKVVDTSDLPVDDGTAGITEGLEWIARKALAGGHGSFAAIGTEYRELRGFIHYWVAVNYKGVVHFIDPQRGQVVMARETDHGFTYHPSEDTQAQYAVHDPAKWVTVTALIVDGNAEPIPFTDSPDQRVANPTGTTSEPVGAAEPSSVVREGAEGSAGGEIRDGGADQAVPFREVRGGCRERLGAAVRIRADRNSARSGGDGRVGDNDEVEQANYDETIRQARRRQFDAAESDARVRAARERAADAKSQADGLLAMVESRVAESDRMRQDAALARRVADELCEQADRIEDTDLPAADSLRQRADQLDATFGQCAEQARRLAAEANGLVRDAAVADARFVEAVAEADRLTADLSTLDSDCWEFANSVEKRGFAIVGPDRPGPVISALTGRAWPPPVWRTNRFGPAGVRPILVVHQDALERVVPRDEDGKVPRAPNPLGAWLPRLNKFGMEADPTRAFNCANCVLALFDLWMHARPTVAAPLSLDGYRAGRADLLAGAESWARSRIEGLTGGRYQRLAGVAGEPVVKASATVSVAFDRIAKRLLASKHGSFAAMTTEWRNGGAHAWAAVNYQGTVYFIDPQQARVVVARERSGDRFAYHDPQSGDEVGHPIFDPAEIIAVDALVVDGKSTPVPFDQAITLNEMSTPVRLDLQPPVERSQLRAYAYTKQMLSEWENASRLGPSVWAAAGAESRAGAFRGQAVNAKQCAAEFLAARDAARVRAEYLERDPTDSRAAAEAARLRREAREHDTNRRLAEWDHQTALDKIAEYELSHQLAAENTSALPAHRQRAVELQGEALRSYAQAVADHGEAAAHHRAEADQFTLYAELLPTNDSQRQEAETWARHHRELAALASETERAFEAVEAGLSRAHTHDLRAQAYAERAAAFRWRGEPFERLAQRYERAAVEEYKAAAVDRNAAVDAAEDAREAHHLLRVRRFGYDIAAPDGARPADRAHRPSLATRLRVELQEVSYRLRRLPYATALIATRTFTHAAMWVRPEVRALRKEIRAALDATHMWRGRVSALEGDARTARAAEAHARATANRLREEADNPDSIDRSAAVGLRQRANGSDQTADRHAANALRLETEAGALRQRVVEAGDRLYAARAKATDLTRRTSQVAPRLWAFARAAETRLVTAGAHHPEPAVSALTKMEWPAPLVRRETEPTSRGTLAVDQARLDEAVPRDEHGKAKRAPDPKHPCLRLINAFGVDDDPTRLINYGKALIAYFELWMHGVPTVAAPLPFDLDGAGGLRPDDVRESIRDIEIRTHGQFQAIADVTGRPGDVASATVNAGLDLVTTQLLGGGHGGFAAIAVRRFDGDACLCAAVNHHGVVYLVDPRTAAVVEVRRSENGIGYVDPDSGDTVDPFFDAAEIRTLDALVVDGHSTPTPFVELPPADWPGRPMNQSDVAHQPPHEKSAFGAEKSANDLRAVLESAAELRDEDKAADSTITDQIAPADAVALFQGSYQKQVYQTIVDHDEAADQYTMEAEYHTRQAAQLPEGDSRRSLAEEQARRYQALAATTTTTSDLYRAAERHLTAAIEHDRLAAAHLERSTTASGTAQEHHRSEAAAERNAAVKARHAALAAQDQAAATHRSTRRMLAATHVTPPKQQPRHRDLGPGKTPSPVVLGNGGLGHDGGGHGAPTPARRSEVVTTRLGTVDPGMTSGVPEPLDAALRARVDAAGTPREVYQIVQEFLETSERYEREALADETKEAEFLDRAEFMMNDAGRFYDWAAKRLASASQCGHAAAERDQLIGLCAERIVRSWSGETPARLDETRERSGGDNEVLVERVIRVVADGYRAAEQRGEWLNSGDLLDGLVRTVTDHEALQLLVTSSLTAKNFIERLLLDHPETRYRQLGRYLLRAMYLREVAEIDRTDAVRFTGEARESHETARRCTHAAHEHAKFADKKRALATTSRAMAQATNDNALPRVAAMAEPTPTTPVPVPNSPADPAEVLLSESADRWEALTEKERAELIEEIDRELVAAEQNADHDGGMTDPAEQWSDAATPSDTTPRGELNTKGDPVDVATGAVIMSQTDVRLPGLLPLVLRRTHISTYRHGRWFGPSWASTLDQRLEITEWAARLVTDDGMLLVFPRLPSTGTIVHPEHGPRWELRRATVAPGGDRYTVTDPARGWTWHYAPPGDQAPTTDGAVVHRLAVIMNRTGQRIEIGYAETGVPVEVRHSGGYRVLVDSLDGRVTGLRRPDFHASSASGTAATADVNGDKLATVDVSGDKLARFGYDAFGNLTEVIGRRGHVQRFTYDDSHRMTGWTDRDGSSYRYHLDDAGRCVETSGAGGMLSERFTYADDGSMTTVVDALGHTTTYHFDARGRATKIVDQLGRAVARSYDDAGRLVAVTDPLGRTIRYGYDSNNDLVEIRRPDGVSAIIRYNGEHLPIATTDFGGALWLRRYDERGNLVETTDPTGTVTRFGYDERGHLASVTDPLGGVTAIGCDEAGLPVVVTDPIGATSRVHRDHAGRVSTAVDRLGLATHLTYTVDGQLASRTLPGGATETWAYDGEGHVIAYTDPTGATTRYEYADFDLVSARIEPDGARYDFEYDAELRLTSVTNPQGLTWTYTRDEAGQLVGETDFNGRTLRYEYDLAGQLVSRTNGLGQTTEFSRDDLGRVLTRRTPDGTTTYGYDAAGRLARASSPTTDLAITYDAAGRILAETVDGRTITYTWNEAGRLIDRRTPAGVHSEWAYDARHVPVGVRVAGQRIGLTHDAAGRRTVLQVATGTSELVLHRAFDPVGRVLAQTLSTALRPTAIPGDEPTIASPRRARLVAHRSQEYRADGLLTRVSDLVTGRHTFTLDRVGRITAVTGQGWSESYAYDAAGNLTGAAGHWPLAGAEHQPALDDRGYAGTVIQHAGPYRFTHDAQGRLTLRQRIRPAGTPLTWRYTWDCDDRLIAVTTPDGTRWTYRYDPVGRRIGKHRHAPDGTIVERVDFTWDGTRLAEQRRHGPGVARPSTTTWEYEPDGYTPIAQVGRLSKTNDPEADAVERFHLVVCDRAGTPAKLVTADGRVTWRREATIWDLTTTIMAADGIDCPLRLPGQYFDPETGHHYNNERYYDPTTARYLTQDPLGLGPAPNPTAYVPNPLAEADPLGLCPADGENHVNVVRFGDRTNPIGLKPRAAFTTQLNRLVIEANLQDPEWRGRRAEDHADGQPRHSPFVSVAEDGVQASGTDDDWLHQIVLSAPDIGYFRIPIDKVVRIESPISAVETEILIQGDIEPYLQFWRKNPYRRVG